VKDFAKLVVFAYGLLIVQTVPVGAFSQFKPDLLIILVVWAGTRPPRISRALFCFVAGLFVDSASGTPLGLFASVYGLVFMACGYYNAVMRADALSSRVPLVFLGAMFSGAALLLVRHYTNAADVSFGAVFTLFIRASLSALCAVPVCVILDALEPKPIGVVGHSSL
jgi:rod shape-determining protein MreD